MIQAMCQFKDADAVDHMCVVSGGSVFVGTPTALVLFTGNHELFDPDDRVCLVRADPYVYAIQAGTIYKVAADVNATLFAATAGTLPPDVTFGTLYRNRLVLSGAPSDPQNYYASKLGTHTDFDYGGNDPDSAFSGNDERAGLIGDRVTALITTQDDTLLIGGDHTLYRMSGDIAAGGSIDRVSGQVGVADFTAWAEDEAGTIYFVGTNGLYRTGPDGLPVPMTHNRLDIYFRAVAVGTHYVHLLWDSVNHGLWIFLTDHETAASTHLWWDARTDGFFPQQFPDAFGPVSSMVFDGNSPTDRLVLLGGRGGFVWKLDPTALTDAGTNITSHVTLGPLRPAGPGKRARLSAADAIMGDVPDGLESDDFLAVLSARTARNGKDLLDAPDDQVTLAQVDAGSQDQVRARLCGNQFALRVDGVDGKYWSLDEVALTFLPAGRDR